MTDLEHDLELSLEWWTPNPYFEDDAEVDCEETANNLTKLGYQKIVWHKITDGLQYMKWIGLTNLLHGPNCRNLINKTVILL